MTEIENIFPFILPFLVISIASILLCFYLLLKKKRGEGDGNVDASHGNVEIQAISSSVDQVEEDANFDQPPPHYSTVDHPPPYSLFDPKLTNVWPGDPPPTCEMYPITIPLAPHWMTQNLHRPHFPQSANIT